MPLRQTRTFRADSRKRRRLCAARRRKQHRSGKKSAAAAAWRGDASGFKAGCRLAGASGSSAGALCRMSAPGVFLCGQAGSKRQKSGVLRRYRLLYARQCDAARYGRYLFVYGGGCHHCTGPAPCGAGYGFIFVYWGFDILCIRNSRRSKRSV